jgi:tubulin polyglutamylase TTLL6/13
VNHSPSFTCDTPFDQMVKEELITDVMRLLNLTPDDRRRFKMAQRARLQQRLMGKMPDKDMVVSRRRQMQEVRLAWEDSNLVRAGGSGGGGV